MLDPKEDEDSMPEDKDSTHSGKGEVNSDGDGAEDGESEVAVAGEGTVIGPNLTEYDHRHDQVHGCYHHCSMYADGPFKVLHIKTLFLFQYQDQIQNMTACNSIMDCSRWEELGCLLLALDMGTLPIGRGTYIFRSFE